MRTQCESCEYRKACNIFLRLYYTYLSDRKCNQGRKVRRVVGIDPAVNNV